MAAVTTDVQAPAQEPETDAGRGWRERLPAATPALLGYLLVRIVGFVVLLVFARRSGADIWWLLSDRFDAGWYRQIVDQGYNATIPVGPDGELLRSNMAFFPLYPGLITGVMAITPLSSAAAGLLVSWLSGLAAAWGIYAVGHQLRDHTTGVVLAILWAAMPHALVELMAYSENLFTALAAWCLYALLRGRWLTAGALCLLAGLTRPTAVALIGAVGLTALVAIVRRRDGWRPWVAGAMAPLGFLGYLAWIGNRVGRWDGYTYLQREGWNVYFDGGRHTLQVLKRVTTGHGEELAFYVIALCLAVALALVVFLLLDRYPLPVTAYAVISVIFVLTAAGGFQGKGALPDPGVSAAAARGGGAGQGGRAHAGGHACVSRALVGVVRHLPVVGVEVVPLAVSTVGRGRDPHRR
jgi:hypothetical protein